MRYIFIRHGQSSNNVLFEVSKPENYTQVRKGDCDLSPLGIEQAQTVGKFLFDKKLLIHQSNFSLIFTNYIYI